MVLTLNGEKGLRKIRYYWGLIVLCAKGVERTIRCICLQLESQTYSQSDIKLFWDTGELLGARTPKDNFNTQRKALNH